MDYINIINILLAIVLVVLLVFLGYNLYLESKPIVRYEPPEFDDYKEDKNVEDNIYDSKILFKTVDNFSGLVSFTVKTKDHNKNFQIDWGNGLDIPYTGSSFSQSLPPVFYPSGKYTIAISCNKDTFDSLEYTASYPDLYNIEYENMEPIKDLKFNGNLIHNKK